MSLLHKQKPEAVSRVKSITDRIVAVGGDPYAVRKMQKRNERMVDNSDAVIAVWDGTPGWISNTVDYVRERGKPILMIDPLKQIMQLSLDDAITGFYGL